MSLLALLTSISPRCEGQLLFLEISKKSPQKVVEFLITMGTTYLNFPFARHVLCCQTSGLLQNRTNTMCPLINVACPWCLYLDLSNPCKLFQVFHKHGSLWNFGEFETSLTQHHYNHSTSVSACLFGDVLKLFTWEVPKQKQLQLWSSIKTRLHVLQGIVPCDALPTQQQWQSWRFIRDPLLQLSWFWSWPASCKGGFSVPKIAGVEWPKRKYLQVP